MKGYFKIPPLFFFIAAGIGVLLRFHFVMPVDGLQYPFWLHTHSHIMFLGWVTNALFLFFTESFIGNTQKRKYKVVFILIQILLAGMLVSFPLQGYGLIPIVLSTLHTVAF